MKGYYNFHESGDRNLGSNYILMLLITVAIILVHIGGKKKKKSEKMHNIFFALQSILAIVLYFYITNYLIYYDNKFIGILFIAFYIYEVWSLGKIYYQIRKLRSFSISLIYAIIWSLISIITAFSYFNFFTYHFFPYSYDIRPIAGWFEMSFEFLFHSFFLSTTISFTNIMPISVLSEALSVIQVVFFYLIIGDSLIILITPKK